MEIGCRAFFYMFGKVYIDRMDDDDEFVYKVLSLEWEGMEWFGWFGILLYSTVIYVWCMVDLLWYRD